MNQQTAPFLVNNQTTMIILIVVVLIAALIFIALGVKITRAGGQQSHSAPRLDPNSRMTKEESDQSMVADWLSTLQEDDRE